jgi:hypothetical protein
MQVAKRLSERKVDLVERSGELFGVAIAVAGQRSDLAHAQYRKLLALRKNFLWPRQILRLAFVQNCFVAFYYFNHAQCLYSHPAIPNVIATGFISSALMAKKGVEFVPNAAKRQRRRQPT